MRGGGEGRGWRKRNRWKGRGGGRNTSVAVKLNPLLSMSWTRSKSLISTFSFLCSSSSSLASSFFFLLRAYIYAFVCVNGAATASEELRFLS